MENREQSHTEHMTVESPEQFIAMFGIREENIPLFHEELGVDIYAHGSEITLSGDPDKVELARLTLDKLSEIALRGENVDRTRIRYAIGLAAEGKADRIGEIMRDVIAITYRGRQVKCKTLGQKKYVQALKEYELVFGVGFITHTKCLSSTMSFVTETLQPSKSSTVKAQISPRLIDPNAASMMAVRSSCLHVWSRLSLAGSLRYAIRACTSSSHGTCA